MEYVLSWATDTLYCDLLVTSPQGFKATVTRLIPFGGGVCDVCSLNIPNLREPVHDLNDRRHVDRKNTTENVDRENTTENVDRKNTTETNVDREKTTENVDRQNVDMREYDRKL